MVRIRQHGEEKKLFDIKQFMEDIDLHFNVDAWRIEIDWCQGENAKQIESVTEGGKEYTDQEFRELYSGIFQTIDGFFQLKVNESVVATLLAVDSSFWEIESGNDRFEKHMLKKYGAYKNA